MSRIALPLLCGACAALSPRAFNVEWDSPSSGPGTAKDGKTLVYKDAMPLGNGRVTALAWANATAGGLGIYLGSQEAMSSQTELFKLALLQISVSPNPYTGSNYFNQTLDLETGTVFVTLGHVQMTVYVDANYDVLRVRAASTNVPPQPFDMTIVASSTRPAGVNWGHGTRLCNSTSSSPDIYVDPLPSARDLELRHPGPNPRPFNHASGSQRPLRTIPIASLPTFGEFAAGSILSYRRNVVADGPTLKDILESQGVGDLYATTPDWWLDRQSGFVLSGAGPSASAFERVNAQTLKSSAPSGAFDLRATVLAVQTESSDDWVKDLAALVANTSAAPEDARAAHEQWWAQFWDRSYIAVNQSQWPVSPSPAPPAPAPAPAPPAASLPVSGAAIWLRASDLAASYKAGESVSTWTGAAGLPSLAQTDTKLQPTFQTDALGPGAPAVQFDGVGTFLSNASLKVSAAEGATYIAVFRDTGSTSDCCSGVMFAKPEFQGISTVPDGSRMVVLADWPGKAVNGPIDVTNLTVATVATYGVNGDVGINVESCEASDNFGSKGLESTGELMVGTRNNELKRYFKGYIGEVIVYPRVLNASEQAAIQAYLAAQWPATQAGEKAQCSSGGSGLRLSKMYAITRYTQAVQSRNTIWPIKFNGMAFVAAMGDAGQADTRDWGACNWWQNTRLPYGSMLPAGDFDIFKVINDYKVNQEKLLGPRTQKYWNHPGMWTTETSHLSGAYCPTDYGCSKRDGYPDWLETSGYLHVDQGGDSGGPEYALMALDYLLWAEQDPSQPSSDAKDYLQVASQVAAYFQNHFQNRSADGRVLVWPAQVLETWWCEWDTDLQTFPDCCENDAPTVSGMQALFDKLVSLPPGLASDEQVANWTRFRDKLMPQLPIDGGVIAPAQVISTKKRNSEGPELYAVHPHRVFTKGRAVASGFNISLGEATVANSAWASRGNSGGAGWAYGINAYALIGDSANAAKRVVGRANTAPALGYRFDGFAPHFQDFEPSADHFANMNRALLEMLIQSGEDGFKDTTIVLLPSWPCDWDVNFKLWGPLRTTVEVEYKGGKLVSLDVQPKSRRDSVKFANCVSEWP